MSRRLGIKRRLGQSLPTIQSHFGRDVERVGQLGDSLCITLFDLGLRSFY